VDYKAVKRDFSGGEIGSRMIMRDDSPLHEKAVMHMRNYMPTLQGPAMRTPATRFIHDINPNDNYARIIPYVTSNNQRALVEILPAVYNSVGGLVTDGAINIIQDINSSTENTQFDPVGPPGQTYQSIVPNGDITGGIEPWELFPLQYAANAGDMLGWWYGPGGFNGTARNTKFTNYPIPGPRGGEVGVKEYEYAWMRNSFTIPQDTSSIIVIPDMRYVTNFGDEFDGNGLVATIKIGTTPGGAEVDTIDISDLPIGQFYTQPTTITGTFLEGEVYYIEFRFEGTNNGANKYNSTPFFSVKALDIRSLVDADGETETLLANVPYSADELREVQYVQSPYNDSADGGNAGKQLVLVHPNYPPKELFFNGTAYVFQDISFTNAPGAWGSQGYPAACGSYGGRLVLGGSKDVITTGDPFGNASETVWATEIGKWYTFTSPTKTPIEATDSIEFTGVYRSPIKWVLGQKRLLVGAESLEYVAESDGIFQPGDLGLNLESTHGSNHVQPVPMGQYILFPSENGTKLRAMRYLADDESWISPDYTIGHPNLLSSGIVRMARMRNPVQMCVVVKGDGEMALAVIDPHENILGWCRVNINANILDACVQTNSNGQDVLYLVVRRKINGTFKVYLEAIVNWSEGKTWRYLNSHVELVNAGGVSTITGLGHLESETVQVLGDGNYLGSFTVSGGEIDLTDEIGGDVTVTNAVVGLPSVARLDTLPLNAMDPSSKKKYSKLTVRTLASYRPIINGDRVPARDTETPMGTSQQVDIVYDSDVGMLGSRDFLTISIEENLPFPSMIMGIFGKVSDKSL